MGLIDPLHALFSPPAYPGGGRVRGGQSYQEERPRMTPPLLQREKCVFVRPNKTTTENHLRTGSNQTAVLFDDAVAVTAVVDGCGRRLRRLRRRASPPSRLVGALRRLRALARAPSLASGFSSTQRAAVSTTSCAARSSSADGRHAS